MTTTAAERNLVIWWTVATIVGWAIGFFVCEALKSFFSTLYSDGLVIGAGIGIAQGVVLRRMAPMGWWLLVSIVGFGIGLAVSEAAFGADPGLAGRALTGLIIGAAAGAAQWLVLRRRFAQAQWWLLAMIPAWIVGWLIIRAAEELEDSSTLVVYLVGGFGAAVVGIVTGVVLTRLARHRLDGVTPPRSQPSA